MMAAAWRWRQHDSGAIMSVLDIEVHQVRVKKELPSTVTCYYKSILYNSRSERHTIHEPEMLSDLLSLLRCEDVVLPEDHQKGVLQSKEIVEYNIAMQLC